MGIGDAAVVVGTDADDVGDVGRGCGGIFALLRSAFIHGCSRHSRAFIRDLAEEGGTLR